jgi:3D (Asp-Asp-Asp) domain-containing protein
MYWKKILIIELLLVIILFILVPVFYKTISASLLKEQETYKDNGHELFKTMSDFTVTAYCPGPCCNGKWSGMTATGKSIKYYQDNNINIIAVDPKIIPLGTKIYYKSKIYTAVDTGRMIKGKRLDVLLPTHKETETFGVKKDQEIKLLY